MAQPSPIEPVSFPGGIADSGGRHACVRCRQGHVVAIALEHGTVLWRSVEALRPLVIAGDEVLALRTRMPAACVALALAGKDAGRERWASDPLPLPGWVELASSNPAQFRITAAVDGSSILVSWRARARYRGGAAPSAAVLKQAARDDAGSVAVERSSGKVTMFAAPAGLERAAGPENGDAAPDTLEQTRIGARRYELVLDDSRHNVRTVLRARDVQTGAILWETAIDEGPARPPRPLRL
jgi:hypothetical protein